MKDVEFEQARELSTVSECSTTTVHSAGSTADYSTNVSKQCRSCYLWWSIQNLSQQP